MSVLRIIISICLLLVSFKTYNHKIYFFQNNKLNRLSVYNPIGSQTDSTPLITASIDTIDTNTYNNDWIAISRDLHVKYGGYLKYGDIITIFGKESKFKGMFVVKDLMNKRYKKSMDVCHKIDTLGLEKNTKWILVHEWEYTNEIRTELLKIKKK